MVVELFEGSLVLLVGPSGSGKSSFAARHFSAEEVVSWSDCRRLVGDIGDSISSEKETRELLHTLVSLRMKKHQFTVVDADNLDSGERKQLRQLAKAHDCLCSVLVFDTRRQASLKSRHQALLKERHHSVHRLPYPIPEALKLERILLPCNQKQLEGPFDIIGDIHGCASELEKLLRKLGYGPQGHPEKRKVIFLGDITDRGPRNLDAYEIVSRMVSQGSALCVVGNHDAKLLRYLQGKNVLPHRGLELTAAEIETQSPTYREQMARFLESLPSHYVLDSGRLVVAHAGLKEAYQGRESRRVHSFCIYGDTTGKVDEFGYPERLNWSLDYRGSATVVFGHTPVPKAEWLNNTINIDTGCVFGGYLTALRYPEGQIVQVKASQVYWEPHRPID